MTGEKDRADARAAQVAKAKTILIKSIIGIGTLLSLGLFFKSRHARDFSDAPKIPDGNPEDLILVEEFKDPDEDQLFHDVMMSFAGDCLKNDRGAGHTEHFEDQHWGYTKNASDGLIEGELKITDISLLPKACHGGLFSKAGTYPVVARPNFLHDGQDIKVSRLSLKLKTDFDVPNVYAFEGHAKELDLLLSEGVQQDPTGDQDGQGFFFRDARQLRYLSWFANHKLWGLATLLNNANSAVFVAYRKIMSGALDTLYKPEHAHKSWEEKDYYSAGPYGLNGVLVKFALRSRQESQAGTRKPGSHGPARDQGAWFETWQAEANPAVFDLCVQVARYNAIPAPSRLQRDPCKAVMATEYTDLVWDEIEAPFIPVGTLTLQPSAVQMEPRPWYFEGRDRWYPRDHTAAYALRFNAWNTLPDMEPVGQLFRARKQVHAMHRETRLRHTLEAETDPAAMCPVPHMRKAG